MLIEILGYTVLGLIGLGAVFAYPVTEFARGMASNPSAHKASRKSCLVSLAGLALLVWLGIELIL